MPEDTTAKSTAADVAEPTATAATEQTNASEEKKPTGKYYSRIEV